MSLNVLLVASEAVPLAKTGGLGDMVSAYAAALREAGVDATILMPAYPGAIASAVGLYEVCALPGLPGGDGALLRGRMPDTGVPLLLVRCDALYAPRGPLSGRTGTRLHRQRRALRGSVDGGGAASHKASAA